MRTGVLCSALTAAIAFGACGGGTPQEVTVFRIGPDGKVVKGTERTEVVMDRQALFSGGYGYSWDCKNDASIFGGETKLYQLINNTLWSNCLGFGLGGNSVMAIGFNEWTYPGTSTTLDSAAGRPSSFRAKMSDPNGGTHHGSHKFYLNTTVGGGCASVSTGPFTGCYDNISPSAVWWDNFHYDYRPKSFDFVRRCAAEPDSTPGYLCS